MEDGITTANTGPTHNKRMDLGAYLCVYVCVHVLAAACMLVYAFNIGFVNIYPLH